MKPSEDIAGSAAGAGALLAGEGEPAISETRVYGCPLARQRLPLCPELELWLLSGQVDLNAQIDPIFRGESIPFWAFCWGGGQAIARYILDHPELVADKAVVDFGAGSGVGAIAAARAGAARAWAVDIDPAARRAALANARLNGVSIEAAAAAPEAWEILLAADVLYEAELFDWLMAQAARGRQVVLSAPERQGSPPLARLIEQARERSVPCRILAEMISVTFPDVDYPTRHVSIVAWG